MDRENGRARYISELKDLLKLSYSKYNKDGHVFKALVSIDGKIENYRVILFKEHIKLFNYL